MVLLLFFLFLSLSSCGIKSKPSPLPEPKFEVKRIGEFVYVLGNKLEVEGFKRANNFWYTKNPERFCFVVKRVNGKSKNVCVPKAPKEVPKVKVKNLKEKVLILTQEEGVYHLYNVIDDLPVPFQLQEFRNKVSLEKSYYKYRVAITKVLKKSIESYPLYIEVKPKPKPTPKPPYDGGYILIEDKLILYWFHEDFENLIGFNVYKNGKRLNNNPIKKSVYIDKVPDREVLYEIRAINSFGLESKSFKIVFP